MELGTALHMVDYFILSIHEALGKHKAIKDNEEWMRLIDEADAPLFRLRESIERQMFDIQHPEDRPVRGQPGNEEGSSDGGEQESPPEGQAGMERSAALWRD